MGSQWSAECYISTYDKKSLLFHLEDQVENLDFV